MDKRRLVNHSCETKRKREKKRLYIERMAEFHDLAKRTEKLFISEPMKNRGTTPVPKKRDGKSNIIGR